MYTTELRLMHVTALVQARFDSGTTQAICIGNDVQVGKHLEVFVLSGRPIVVGYIVWEFQTLNMLFP